MSREEKVKILGHPFLIFRSKKKAFRCQQAKKKLYAKLEKKTFPRRKKIRSHIQAHPVLSGDERRKRVVCGGEGKNPLALGQTTSVPRDGGGNGQGQKMEKKALVNAAAHVKGRSSMKPPNAQEKKKCHL